MVTRRGKQGVNQRGRNFIRLGINQRLLDLNQGQLNIVVIDGVAQLWEVVYSADEKDALRIAAETTPGVRAVEDRLATAGQWGYA